MSDLALVLLNPTVALNYFTLSAGVDALTPSMPDQVGPRLEDLKVTSSTRGADIKRVSGTSRIAGNIIWSSGLKETRHEDEIGKGGSETVTVVWYTYSCSFTIGLCEGEIQGVRRVWADAKLIYDVGDNASAAQVLASKQSGMTIYNGDEDQPPSSLTQSDKGINLTPASRGLSYIEFDDMQLEEYGNRIPNINVEVFSSRSDNKSYTLIDSIQDGVESYDNSGGDIMSHFDGVYCYYVKARYANSFRTIVRIDVFKSTPESIIKIKSYDAPQVQQPYNTISPSSSTNFPCRNGYSYTRSFIYEQFSQLNMPPYTSYRDLYLANHSDSTADGFFMSTESLTSTYSWAHVSSDVIYVYEYGGAIQKIRVANSTNKQNHQLASDTGIVINDHIPYTSNISGIIRANDDYIFVSRPSSATATYILKFSTNDFSFIGYIEINTSIPHFNLIGSDSINYISGGFIHEHGNFSNVITKTHDWRGFVSSEAGSIIDIENVVLSDSGYVHWHSGNHLESILELGYTNYQSGLITLSSVIEKLCLRSGLLLSDIDTSTLTDNVTGQVLISKDLASTSLRGLLTAYNIKVYEADWKIKFIKIDEESPELIDNNDLGAGHETTTEVLTTNRVQSTELPRSINIQYASQLTDYQTSVQKAQRVITNV